MAVLAPISGQPIFSNFRGVGDAVAYFYDAGTTTPRTVYQSASGSPHTQPVAVLGSGNFPAIYVQGTDAYKIRVQDGSGVLLAEYDELQGEVASSGGGGGGGTTIPTGFVMFAYSHGAVADWVRANGRTIGSGSSGGTERANADCEPLFLHLWDKDPNLAVSGGRGATATADWAANKTIALPDFRGRVPIGLDDMGSSAAGRLSGGTFGFGSATALGSYGGVPTNTLATGNLPSHNHTASTGSSGSHTHTGTTASSGSHNHTYSKGAAVTAAQAGANASPFFSHTSDNTSSDGAHTHSFTTDSGGSHTHTVTVGNTGSGTAVNNLQPFILGTTYLKL
jgi:microcystin-dependent protein